MKSCFETAFCQKVVLKPPFQNVRKNYHGTGSEITRIYIWQLVHNCRSLYLSFVRSQFEHCSSIWRPNTETEILMFEKLQKKKLLSGFTANRIIIMIKKLT